jgi:hypothetical protein
LPEFQIGFVGVDSKKYPVRRVVVADVVEDEELRLGADVDGVGEPVWSDVLLGLLGDVARVAAVGLAGDRVDHDVADEESVGWAVKGSIFAVLASGKRACRTR